MRWWEEGNKDLFGRQNRGLMCVSKSPMMNYLCNLSKKYCYIYVETPKVACSTIKMNLQFLELGEENKFRVHDKSNSPLLSPSDSSINLKKVIKNYFKFCFVRNPYDRVLSCYLDKVKPERKKSYRVDLGLPHEGNVSFEDFLDSVRCQKRSDMNIHWIPQSEILAVESIKYDFVGRFDNFENNLTEVIALICERNNIAPPDNGLYIKRHSPHQTDAFNLTGRYMTIRAASLIQEIYKEDFEVFGFSY